MTGEFWGVSETAGTFLLSAMGEKTSSPPVCVQILSLVALVCFGFYSIVKGASFGFFNWWYILGGSCIIAAAFASFRVYEVCVIMAQREISVGLMPKQPVRSQADL
ncbi:hypothetical protein AAFF_G00373190 [Aldrovandia affinis]|uniref:Uncharacterized protein n=1 Tax=Aldrovandia affinis TaxID=143900 RepID=A0AAD7SGE4_9TELE|nr:hypothetical protein AAFF_G00373190 [Aldrovandia affinis]